MQIAGLSPATLGPAICSFAAMHVPSTLSKGRDFHVSIRRCAQTSLNLQKIPGAALSCRHPFFFISFSWSIGGRVSKEVLPGKRNLKWQKCPPHPMAFQIRVIIVSSIFNTSWEWSVQLFCLLSFRHPKEYVTTLFQRHFGEDDPQN